MAKRIGVLGGTFDPIHIGHLRGALEVIEACQLDQLRLIPCAVPPHRATPDVDAEQRLAMVRLAVADEPLLSVDDQELRRAGPSWTLDTLISLRQGLLDEDQLLLIMGWDSFCSLDRWHRWQELLDYCHILVLQRPNSCETFSSKLNTWMTAKRVHSVNELRGGSGQVAFIEQPYLPVSATHIRHLLRTGKNVRFLLPDKVYNYIVEHGLYRDMPHE